MMIVAIIMVILYWVSVGKIVIVETTMLEHYVENNVKAKLQMRYWVFVGVHVVVASMWELSVGKRAQ
jgi:hypothetical protein